MAAWLLHRVCGPLFWLAMKQKETPREFFREKVGQNIRDDRPVAVPEQDASDPKPIFEAVIPLEASDRGRGEDTPKS